MNKEILLVITVLIISFSMIVYGVFGMSTYSENQKNIDLEQTKVMKDMLAEVKINRNAIKELYENQSNMNINTGDSKPTDNKIDEIQNCWIKILVYDNDKITYHTENKIKEKCGELDG